jgi:hypothetical protein
MLRRVIFLMLLQILYAFCVDIRNNALTLVEITVANIQTQRPSYSSLETTFCEQLPPQEQRLSTYRYRQLNIQRPHSHLHVHNSNRPMHCNRRPPHQDHHHHHALQQRSCSSMSVQFPSTATASSFISDLTTCTELHG